MTYMFHAREVNKNFIPLSFMTKHTFIYAAANSIIKEVNNFVLIQ